MMTRRELLTLAASAAVLRGATAPASPVSIGRASSYDENLAATLTTMFDQIGGAQRLVRNKTVTVKLNLTGPPSTRFKGLPPSLTHYTHPKTVMAMAHVLDVAGARRIRFVESAWAWSIPSLDQYMLDSGWDVNALKAVSSKVEFENTNNLGLGKQYSRLKIPGGGHIFPAFDLNHSYEDTDVFVSMAKLKNHATCGVTLTMKNCFGITPASIYGDNAGIDGPNEKPTSSRASVCHSGSRQPSKTSPGELDPSSSRDPGYRMPRIVADIVAMRPVDIAFIDGIETTSGGEGPWVGNLKSMKPGVMILGSNPVSTDAVATTVMGYDPRSTRGTKPFENCDNHLLLAEALGVGSADLSRIDVRGVPVAKVRTQFR